jgi:serine/threonine protein kinase
VHSHREQKGCLPSVVGHYSVHPPPQICNGGRTVQVAQAVKPRPEQRQAGTGSMLLSTADIWCAMVPQAGCASHWRMGRPAALLSQPSFLLSGVAHRDIKPQNLLLSGNGILKIADFGLAASFDPDPAVKECRRGLRRTMCGSPLYMAPELLVLKDGSSYNALASDVWSCGAVLAAMVLDHPPFPATSMPELIQMTSNSRGLKLPDHLPRDLRLLIRGMLNTDPMRRLTIEEVRKHPWFRTSVSDTLVRMPYSSPLTTNPPRVHRVRARISMHTTLIWTPNTQLTPSAMDTPNAS